MSALKALPGESQSGCDVLFFDSQARQSDLWECANLRLGAVESMLSELANCRSSGLEGAAAMPAVAGVCALLMSDARGMLDAIGQHLIKQDVAALNRRSNVEPIRPVDKRDD